MTARAGAPGAALLALAAVAAVAAVTVPDRGSNGDWTLVVLGIAQDGGMPHLGCQSPPCSEARAGRRRPEKVACLGLRHRPSGTTYLFDATPDFPAQVHALTGGPLPDGIFLTHAHIGHYTGLMYLGREVAGARGVPVHCTARMAEFLTRNGPWGALVADGRIALQVLEPDRPLALPHGLRVTAFTVPHRDEYSDTVGYLIEGPRRSAAFVPDIDRWEKWNRSVRDLADRLDLLFVDGTFSSARELPGRDISEIPHPLMPETRALVRGTRARLLFIHLNHTNPALLGGPDVAREGMTFAL
ncbi:MAG TPA: MBL fold metallo-hydrolase [Vicinamibacteria bacterium]